MTSMYRWAALFACVVMAAGPARSAQAAADDPVAQTIQAMQQGGLVLVWRNTETERREADTDLLHLDNVQAQRPLSQSGERQAEALGRILRDLKVPVGAAYSSRFARSVETAKRAGFDPQPLDALTDGGSTVTPEVAEERRDAFRKLINAAPAGGVNTLLVADQGAIADAVSPELWGMREGEVVVLKKDPTAAQGFVAVGRVKLTELRDHWKLAAKN